MAKKVSKRKNLRLLVTFDIVGARPGDRRYQRVDELLASHGTVLRVFRQVRLLTTATDPRTLTPLISAITGPRSRILIAHAAKPYRFVLGNQCDDAHLRGQVRTWMGGAK